MNNQELNEKINNFAGTKGIDYLSEDTGLSSLVKWAAPKLLDRGVYWEIHQEVGYHPIVKLFWNEKAFWKFTNLKWIFKSGETATEALCLAIEKLLDRKVME